MRKGRILLPSSIDYGSQNVSMVIRERGQGGGEVLLQFQGTCVLTLGSHGCSIDCLEEGGYSGGAVFVYTTRSVLPLSPSHWVLKASFLES